jgi:hypothetical protein
LSNVGASKGLFPNDCCRCNDSLGTSIFEVDRASRVYHIT